MNGQLKNKMRRNKMGVSEIISYIILVTITISISVGVYAWLRYQVPNCNENDIDCFSPVDCPDGTSIMINEYKCGSGGINMTLENNGRFNISGVILAVTSDSSKIPNEYLVPIGSKTIVPGEFIFHNPLNPNAETEVKFSKKTKKNQYLTKIEEIKMQIFISGTSRKMCKNVIIRETLKNCNMD